MQIHIQTHGFTLSQAIKEHALRRLSFALAHSAAHVRRVVVRLDGLNGPRGVADRSCRVEVQLDNEPTALIEERGGDLYRVISLAVGRAGRSVAKRLGRARERVRQGLVRREMLRLPA